MPLVVSYISGTNPPRYAISEGSTAEGDLVIPSTYNDGINGEGTVTHISDRAFKDCTTLTSVVLPDTIVYLGTEAFRGCSALQSVSLPSSNIDFDTIGQNAFGNCSSLQNINIPSSVKYIYNAAFQYCRNLLSVNFAPNSSLIEVRPHAFLWCDKLKSINFNSLKYLGHNVFWYCYDLETISLPEGLETIGGYAFVYCYKLKNIILPNSLKSIGQEAFAFTGLTNITIPNNVTAIGRAAFQYNSDLISASLPANMLDGQLGEELFRYCQKLASPVIFPEGITYIPERFLEDCRLVPSITLPSTLNQIRDYAFNECRSITSVILPQSLNLIGYASFRRCSSLVDINIPNSVSQIRGFAFDYCSNLLSISMSDNVTSLGREAFRGCNRLHTVRLSNNITFLEDWMFSGCSDLQNINIPTSLVRIGWAAFIGCSKLNNITLPNSLTRIDGSVFNGCLSLTSINIPNGVTIIEEATFSFCRSLQSVSLPNTLTTISKDAFRRCDSLQNINFLPNSLTFIGDRAFGECSSLLSINIPQSVTYLGESAFMFAGATAIEINISSNLNNINSNAFLMAKTLNFYVDQNNLNYSSENGVLYNKNKTKLISYPKENNRTSFSVPSLVEEIGEGAFFGANLLDINLNPQLIKISNMAFSSCGAISKMTIPSLVQEIGEGAFVGMTNLKSLIFLCPYSTNFSNSLFGNTNNVKIYRYSKNIGWPASLANKPVRTLFADLFGITKKKDYTETSRNKISENLSKVSSRKKQLINLSSEIKTDLINKIKKTNDNKKPTAISKITELSTEQEISIVEAIPSIRFIEFEYRDATNWFSLIVSNQQMHELAIDGKRLLNLNQNFVGIRNTIPSTSDGRLVKVTSLNNNKIFIISPFAKDLFKPQNQINSNTTITSIPELVSIAENWSESTKKAFWALLNTDNLWQIFDVENNQLYLNFNVYPSGVGPFLDPRIYMPTTGWCKANLRRDRVSFSWKTRILNIQKPSLAPGMVGTTAIPNHNIYGNYFALSNVSLTNYKTTLNSPIFKMNDRTNSNVYYVSKYPNVPLYLDLHATQSNDPRLNLPQTILEQGEYFYARIFNSRPFPISVRFWTRSVGATQTSPGSPTTMPVASYEQELSLDPNSVYFFIGQKAQDGSVGWIYTTDDIEGVSKKWKITADKVENNGVPLHLFEANDSGSFLPDNLSWTQLYQDTNLEVLVGTDLRNMFFSQDPSLRGPNGAISPAGSGSGLDWGVGITLVESASSGGGIGLTYFY